MFRFFCWLIAMGFSLTAAAQPLHVMSFNIRYDNPADSMNAWPHRKDKVVSQIRYHQVHILGVQEALHHQMKDLQNGLKNFKSIGVGRDGGSQAEYAAIFYDTTRVALLKSNTFWLSETPDIVASKGWDAALTRTASWGQFRDRLTGSVFFVFNTHLDHVGTTARRESARLLLQKAAAIAGDCPVMLTGDFNAHPQDEPIRLLLAKNNPYHFLDSRLVSLTPHYGPEGTFNGFKKQETADTPIDYIFVRGPIEVRDHATLSPTWKGRFASDHFAVLARINLK
ncbi:endonuclease/exonuclease/phosphatase family protein [Niabella insulamsoli]|uniref:endonuclease/exonuclease/phosphatase family protein n=1 Tax=Niabella insulamsoli TaxID=3144874 RepID=UPI0031FD8175